MKVRGRRWSRALWSNALWSKDLWVSLCFVLLTVAPASAVPWLPFGPDGGDARRVVADPADHTHLYLGTANGWLYESHNTGASWRRLARVGQRDDLVLDSVVVDAKNPKHLIVGTRVIGSVDGGIYLSYDSGRTWTSQADMRGESVQALRASPSDSNLLIAGTLKGVFRSTDGGKRWDRISPADSTEIHNIASVAIDPVDPKIIYVGTWHLPWKTTDGGEHWENIKEGIIDDSDVFSIIIDPDNPKSVYASACSGIYKSEDAGTLFHKIQGIPSTARRTRVLMQDPNSEKIVFAGTTEGLWRSNDAGKTWSRTTGPDVIVNDVSIDKTDSKHVLIATDRGGVLSSEDGGDTFHPSNGGFSARQITAVRRDRSYPGTVLVGVVNDKELGGVFLSENGGLNWVQRSQGLEGRDIFALGQAPDGTYIAGTAHGLFRFDKESKAWTKVEAAPSGAAAPEPVRVAITKTRPPVPVGRNKYARHQASAANPLRKPRPATKAHARPTAGKVAPSAHTPSSRHVVHRPVGPASSRHSSSAPRPAAPMPRKPLPAPAISAVPPPPSTGFDGSVYGITNSDQAMLAITSIGLLRSEDNGLSWTLIPQEHSADWRFLAAAKEDVVAASLHTMAFSADAGKDWSPMLLPDGLTQVGAVSVEPSGRIWVGGREGVFTSRDAGHTWSTPKNLFVNTVNSLYYDETTSRMLVTTGGYTSIVFIVHLPDLAVTFADTGWNLRMARPMGDHLIAATMFDGLVIQPRMVATPMADAPSVHPANPAPPAQ